MPTSRRARGLTCEQTGKLLDHLNERLRGQECDGTMRNVRAFLADQGLDVPQTLRWLRGRGAYCDCEVVMNVR